MKEFKQKDTIIFQDVKTGKILEQKELKDFDVTLTVESTIIVCGENYKIIKKIFTNSSKKMIVQKIESKHKDFVNTKKTELDKNVK